MVGCIVVSIPAFELKFYNTPEPLELPNDTYDIHPESHGRLFSGGNTIFLISPRAPLFFFFLTSPLHALLFFLFLVRFSLFFFSFSRFLRRVRICPAQVVLQEVLPLEVLQEVVPLEVAKPLACR